MVSSAPISPSSSLVACMSCSYLCRCVSLWLLLPSQESLCPSRSTLCTPPPSHFMGRGFISRLYSTAVTQHSTGHDLLMCLLLAWQLHFALMSRPKPHPPYLRHVLPTLTTQSLFHSHVVLCYVVSLLHASHVTCHAGTSICSGELVGYYLNEDDTWYFSVISNVYTIASEISPKNPY